MITQTAIKLNATATPIVGFDKAMVLTPSRPSRLFYFAAGPLNNALGSESAFEFNGNFRFTPVQGRDFLIPCHLLITAVQLITSPADVSIFRQTSLTSDPSKFTPNWVPPMVHQPASSQVSQTVSFTDETLIYTGTVEAVRAGSQPSWPDQLELAISEAEISDDKAAWRLIALPSTFPPFTKVEIEAGGVAAFTRGNAADVWGVLMACKAVD